MSDEDLLLPEGSVLLHIGPYKTGSTALQGALFEARDGFAAHGVYYPGGWRRAAQPGWSALRWSPRGRPAPKPLAFWKAFAADVRDHAEAGMRVCISTEDFGSTTAQRAREIVEDLGADRVHVVAVARRLDRVLPSQWQERVKGFDRRSYDTWLHEVLGDEPSPARKAFWRSHDLARTTSRWVPPVRAQNFRVITTDDSDRTLLFRLFEGMLGLPDGVLQVPAATNSSLSANACELLRRVNEHVAAEGWSDELYNATVYRGAIQEMLAAGRSPLDRPIPPLPAWAREQAAERSERLVAGLRDSGVRFVGDPQTLLVPRAVDDAAAAEEDAAPDTISLDQATAALVGAIRGAADREERVRATEKRRHREAVRDVPSAEAMGARELVRLTGRRVADAAKRRLAR